MKNIAKIVFKRHNLPIFAASTAVLLALYFFALVQSTSFSAFVKSNSTLFVWLQIIFSIANALVGAASIVIFVEIFRLQNQIEGNNAASSILAMFVSVATTGCYVCGSLLVPGLGVAASFATMPLGGLEIKILSLALLIYSTNNLYSKLNGTCRVYNNKFVVLNFSDQSYKLNLKKLHELRPTFITVGLLLFILILPQIMPNVSWLMINDPSVYVCVAQH